MKRLDRNLGEGVVLEVVPGTLDAQDGLALALVSGAGGGVVAVQWTVMYDSAEQWKVVVPIKSGSVL